ADATEALLAVGCLGDNGDVDLGVEERLEAGAYERLVVGQEDLDHQSGSRAVTRKPPAGFGPASSWPPRATARSRTPVLPVPAPLAAGTAAPWLSSSTSTSNWSDS